MATSRVSFRKRWRTCRHVSSWTQGVAESTNRGVAESFLRWGSDARTSWMSLYAFLERWQSFCATRLSVVEVECTWCTACLAHNISQNLKTDHISHIFPIFQGWYYPVCSWASHVFQLKGLPWAQVRVLHNRFGRDYEIERWQLSARAVEPEKNDCNSQIRVPWKDTTWYKKNYTKNSSSRLIVISYIL